MTVKPLSRHASDLMSSPVVTVNADARLAEAATLMIRRNVGCLPVVDPDGSLAGLLTERMLQTQLAGTRPASSISFQKRTVLEIYEGHPGQLDRAGAAVEDVRNRKVRDVMDDRPITVAADAEVWQVADAMMENHVSHVPVLRGTKLAGVVARHDLVRELSERKSTAARR